MNRRGLLLVVVLIAAVAGAVIFLLPMLQPLGDSDTEYSVAPERGSVVQVENPRLVLPPRAGQLASLNFDITNSGERSLQLVDVAIQHAEQGMAEIEGPAPQELANVDIQSGETVRFGSTENRLVVADYDENVVPGSTVNVTLTFGNAETVSFSAPVVIENPHTNLEGPLD